MKIKLFRESFLSHLEERVNDFISNVYYDVVDIKYQDGKNGPSVLIIYYDMKNIGE